MPMTIAGNQTSIANDKLYYFSSGVPATTTCLVMAHGGVSHPLSTFMVPPAVTLYFYTTVGESYSGNIKATVLQPHHANTLGRPDELLRFDQGTPCIDYTLTKILGRHETHAKELNPVVHTTYEEIETYMRQAPGIIAYATWTPDIVTVRNRSWLRGGSTMKLSAVIDAVRTHKPTLTDIYIAACRVEFIRGKRVAGPRGNRV